MENITSSKLFRTRQGTLVLGVAAAVLAAIALIVYLHEYRNSVNTKAQPLTVLVAKRLIQKGTSGTIVASSGMYQVSSIPKSEAQTGVLVQPSSLTGKVALTDIYPGQQLTDSDFGTSTANPLIERLNKGQRAVVVALDSPSEVGGQISSGDHVDVWALLSSVGANGATKPIAKEVLQNMYVLNVSSANVTLRATPKQAGEMIFASENAKIWLALRPTVGSVTKPPVITSKTLLGG